MILMQRLNANAKDEILIISLIFDKESIGRFAQHYYVSLGYKYQPIVKPLLQHGRIPLALTI